MPDDPRVSIEILSAWIARVAVRHSSGDFGLYREEEPPGVPSTTRTYQLGYRDAPLYRLRMRDAPGEAWELTPRRSGRVLEKLETFDAQVEQAYLDWFVESGDLQGLELPWVLPAGRYFLVQTSRPFYPVRWMTLGGARVITSRNVLQLRSQKAFYACAFGAELLSPPVMDQPLVGLVLPNYFLEQAPLHGLFFFSFSRSNPVARERTAAPGAVLLVPIEGPLVLDSKEGVASAGGAACSPEAWTEARARQFVDWCARLTEEWRE